MGLLSNAMHCFGHAAKKERFRLLLISVAVRCGDKLGGFWYSERSEKLRKSGP